ncbi:heat shock protein DnaJ, partial [Zopfia rhizophila CBS 207.26]
YAILAVSKTASQDEIKKAHRKLSLQYHPDRAKPEDKEKATDQMAEINRAYDVLKDERLRGKYD